ncbi:MAG TPA: hypothetical protein VFT10_06865 [Solirubrobacterales bacterium]|nr:hypothetical protein [Solirubrobacterales bacterium]
MPPLIEYLLLPFATTLLAAYVDRHSGRLSRALVRAAARLLPAARRDDERDEWLDHVAAAGENGMLPLTRALSIALLAAPLLAIGLRVGRSRRRV